MNVLKQQRLCIEVYIVASLYIYIIAKLCTNNFEYSSGKNSSLKVEYAMPDERWKGPRKVELICLLECFYGCKVLNILIFHLNDEMWMLHTTVKFWIKLDWPISPKYARLQSEASCFFTITLHIAAVCKEIWKNCSENLWIICL